MEFCGGSPDMISASLAAPERLDISGSPAVAWKGSEALDPHGGNIEGEKGRWNVEGEGGEEAPLKCLSLEP